MWAAGILGNMNGAMGVAAWRWWVDSYLWRAYYLILDRRLFYIEGAITIVIGFLAMCV